MSDVPGPIFIIGAPRSGTSILTWCLGQHSNILPLEESNWIGKFAIDLVSTYALAAGRGERSSLIAAGIDAAAYYERMGEAVDRMLVAGRLVVEARAQQAAQAEPSRCHPAIAVSHKKSDPKRRWVDGTPEHAFYVPGLRRLFPNAKFVHILRDAPSVARSLIHFKTVAGHDVVGNADEAYDYWLRCVRACVEAELAYGPEVVLRVRYADLVASPEAILGRCLQFLGETHDARCADAMAVRLNSSRAEDKPFPLANVPSRKSEEAAALSVQLLTSAQSLLPNPYKARALDAAFDRRAAYLGRLDDEFQSAVGLLGRAERELATLRPLTYHERIRELARAHLPYDAVVLVATRGDPELLRLEGRSTRIFPADAFGRFAGTPADGANLVEQLRSERDRGAQFLMIPATSLWWLEYFIELQSFLANEACRVADATTADCHIFNLMVPGPAEPATEGEP